MSVIGFDLGYQSCHVAIVRHGGVEVIFNEYSDRRSLSLVAFSQNRRLMGHSAKNQQIMNYRNTIYGFRDLLGRKFSDPNVQQEIKSLPFEIVGQKNDAIGIKVKNGGEESIFSPKQVTAMMLTYLKQIAEKALERPVVDCVISVPSFFTDAQRRALVDASTIAGLNCLRLFNDTTAAALAYGLYKQDLPVEPEKPRNIVFVDMGYSSLQVAICSFQKGKLTVLARTFDPFLGGRKFDFQLVKYFVNEFKKKYKIDVTNKPKQLLRLMGEVEKVKKMLSTVTTPIPLNIECFYEDRDVSSSIKRETFEELCSDHFVRIRNTLSLALAKSKLSLGDIDSVEIIGGSCRIPAVKDVIADVFKRELSTTLNLDEAVCRGCGLQCAMLSPTFKVRDFSVTDIQPYSIQLKWEQPMEGDSGEMVVYKEGDIIFHSKMLTFYRKGAFQLVASYAHPKEMPYDSPQIGTFTITNIAPTEDGEASKVKLKVRMNIHGIFFVKDATMVEKQKQPPEAMETDPVANEVQLPDVEKMADKSEEKTVPDGGGPVPEEEKMNDDPAQADEGDSTEGSTTEGSTADLNGGNGKENDGKEGAAAPSDTKEGAATPSDTKEVKDKEGRADKPPAAKKQKKPTVKYIDLPITSLTASMTKKEMDGAREIEVNLNYQDQLEQEKVDARNSVEEYVYNMRDKLYSLAEFVSEEDKAAFNQLLSATEDWLYDEGEDQSKKVYVERLALLKKSGDPIVTREQESVEIPRAFNELGAMVVHYEKVLAAYEQGEEAYAHLEVEEMGKVAEQVKTKRQWLESQMQAWQTTPKHTNAPVSSSQVIAEAKNLKTAADPIVSKPKPKVEPPKDEQPPEQPKTEAEETKMEEDTKPKTEAEETKMEEDTKPNPTQNPPSAEDMDLD